MREFFKKVWEKIKEISIPNLVFLIVILVFIIMPNTKFNKDELDVIEKRPLAKAPVLFKDGYLNKQFGREFESFYNDRFRKRGVCIDIHILFKCFINARHENQIAMEGRNGWYYYKGERSVENFQNKLQFSDEEKLKIKKNLERLNKWCKDRGITLIVLIPPDKGRIYPENYPSYYKKLAPKGRVQVLDEYLKSNSNVTFIYPMDDMLDYKSVIKEPLFYYTDTHWTAFGSYIAYRALAKEIAKSHTCSPLLDINKVKFGSRKTLKEENGKEGDICINLKVKNGCSDYKYIFPEGVDNHKRDPLKVVILGDSFAGDLTRWLVYAYESVVHLWYNETGELFDNFSMELWEDKILKEKPDVFILELADRFSYKMLELYKD